MRETVLKKLARWHAFHPWQALLVVAALTAVLFICATQIQVTMRTSDLLPEKDPKVVQFNKILDEFVTATNLVVVVQGEEKRIKAFADDLAPKILDVRYAEKNDEFRQETDRLRKKIEKLQAGGDNERRIAEHRTEIAELEANIDKSLFQRVDYKAEIDFIRDHLLMLVKEEDLRNVKDIYTDPNLVGLLTNLNNSMEKEYVGQEESIPTREKEDGAVGFLDGIQGLVLHLKKAVQERTVTENEIRETADKLLFGDPYMLSYDRAALVMIAIPNFTIMDRDLLMVAAEKVQYIVDEQLKAYPGVKAGLSGSIAREHDEQVYSLQSLNYSTIIALIVIFILLVIAFRMWVAPIFAVTTLVVGVIWALGVAWLVVGQLNMMTSMMSVILLGLGVDFAIHLITGFTERRAAGDSIAVSLEKTYLRSAKGIITGALTTACAFLTLIISQARGMREMGIVTGVGLLSILMATLLFLPVMMVFRERRIDRKRKKMHGEKAFVRRDISFRFLGRMGDWLSRKYGFTIMASCVVTLLLIWSASRITFDHNYMNIEPEGLTSIALTDTIMAKFDLNIEYALILADDVDESRNISKECRDLNSVALTDDISLYLPSPEEQAERIPHIIEVRDRIRQSSVLQTVNTDELPTFREEVERLEMNVMEIQDMAFLNGQDKVDNKCKEIVGDPDVPDSRNIIREFVQMLEGDGAAVVEGLSVFQNKFAPYYKESVIRICSIDPIRLDELPLSIQDRYSNKNRNQFLITVYAAGDLWADRVFLDRFVGDLERVSEKATGMPPLFVALIEIFGRDGRNAIILTLFIVFLLLWVDFGNPQHALMAMVPLACGIFWMVGFMRLIGMQLNVVNVIGLPLIIGIGIDDGVHIIHRWKFEGAGKIKTVFSSTGKAIFLTSLTTMFAFGSLVFSIFRGWASFGGSLFLGVGACFLTTVFILPGILGIVESKSRRGENRKK